jgi:hypothetical protein
MTKIGDSGISPKPTEERYHQQLNDSIVRFENALSGYQVANDSEETAHLQAVMNQQMELIRSAIGEIKRLGISKQGEIVASDYKNYCEDPSPEKLTALQQDLTTLREYNYTD